MLRQKLFSLAIFLVIAGNAAAETAAVHHIQRGDISLVYETEGKGDPILLLAGGPGVTPYSVKPVQDLLSKDHLAVLVHQRGTGKTALPKPDDAHISLKIFIDDVDAVRQDLHAEKITLIGHSWGGMLAMAYAGAHPENVSRLILMDSGGPNLSFAAVFTDNIQMHLLPEDLALGKQASDEGKKKNPLSSFHYLQSILPGYFYKRENAVAFMKTMKPDDYNAALRPLLIGYDVTKSVVNYRGPVSIIQGRQDPIDPSTVQLNMKYLPQAKVFWVERAGHIPWLEQDSAFQRAMSSALD
jgi:proline iminopeptidase